MVAREWVTSGVGNERTEECYGSDRSDDDPQEHKKI